jgi:hypothetical protein
LLLEILDCQLYDVPTGKQILTRNVTFLTLTNLESISTSYCRVQRTEQVGINCGASYKFRTV